MKSKAGYWILTAMLAIWLAAGGLSDLTGASLVREIMRTLHYPDYMLLILGSCKLLAIPALLYPKAGRLREWAYAGITFNSLGAFLSHWAVRDQFPATILPLVMLSIMAGSYLLGTAMRTDRFSAERQ